ncbi:MAG: oligosaccharide flippase family protein [Acidimicrobiales bacterium]
MVLNSSPPVTMEQPADEDIAGSRQDGQQTMTDQALEVAEPAEGRKLSFALFWSFLQGFGAQGLTVVVTFLLARQLGPEVFGLAALAIVYVLFVEMLMRQGLSVAIVQRPDLTDRDLDTAFWLLGAISLAIAGATVGLAGVWADINREPQLRELTIVLSVVVPIRALAVVQDALSRRRLEFKALAWRTFVASIVSGVVALAMALSGRASGR